jgi:hypothetical protein
VRLEGGVGVVREVSVTSEELNMKKEKTELPTYLPLGWAESPRVLILSCMSFKEWMME